MKGFIKQLLTNRLGIILAALNLCCLVAPGLGGNVFLYFQGDFNTLLKNHSLFSVMMHNIKILTINANFIAFGLSDLSTEILKSVFWNSKGIAVGVLSFVLTLFFITLQWLFIGWTAKKIASAIRPKLD